MKSNDWLREFFVSPLEVVIINQVPVPEHPNTRFDDDAFRNAVAHSVSLTADEKVVTLRSVPTLTQEQIDTLFGIFAREAARFEVVAEKFLIAAEAEEAGREAVRRRAAFTVLPGGRA